MKHLFRLAAVACAAGTLLYINKKNQVKEEVRIRSPKGVDFGEYVQIGGIPQYLYHRGKDTDNPVMLFLHGGPGGPEMPILHTFQLPWESRVTVVHWDQRNSGKSFCADRFDEITATTTTEQLIEDTLEVVQHLKQKYHKDKIILLGHSWGSVLGSLFVKRYPEHVLAYIGTGQVVDMVRNEQIGYEKVMEAAKKSGNQQDIEKLQSLLPYPGSYEDFEQKVLKLRKLQSKYQQASGSDWKIISAALLSPFYTLGDCAYFLNTKNVMAGQQHLVKDMFSFDLPALGMDYQIPYFVIQGENDWQTPYSLAKEFTDGITAPISRFYSIPDAGHSAMLDQKERFQKALFDILDQVTPEKGDETGASAANDQKR